MEMRQSNNGLQTMRVFEGVQKGGDGMNHDYAHCADFKDDCPKKCFRAQLVRDLKQRTDLLGLPFTWMSFKGTSECKKEVTE